MTSQPQGLRVLADALAAHGVDESLGRAVIEETPDSDEVLVDRLDRLDDAVSDFVERVRPLLLPARAAEFDEQLQALDRWGNAFDALDGLKLLSAAIGHESDVVVSEHDWSGTLQRQALSQLF